MFESLPVWVLLAFFVAHICVRSFLHMPMGYDEGEQFIVTQDFAIGYSSQPPLYNWLQHVLFDVFGVSTFAMILLKQLILLAIFATTYALWRKTGLSVALASGCTYSLFLLNEVGWELQRTRTHLALAVLMVALFALTAVTIFRQSGPRAKSRSAILYGALGAWLGLGLLAKYNFVFLPCGLAVTGLLSKQLRPTILTPWSLLALFIASAIFSAHGLWMLDNFDWIVSQSMDKFGLLENTSVLQSRRLAANAFGGAVFMFFLLPIIVGAVLHLDWRDWNFPSSAVFDEMDERSRKLINIIGVASALAIGMAFVIVVGFGIPEVLGRWLVPSAFLSLGPLLLRTRILRGPNTHRIYWLVVLTMMLASFIAITKVAGEGLKGNSSKLPVLAGSVWNTVAAHPPESAVIIEDRRLAGLIRLQYPSMRILAPGYALPDLQSAKHLVVIAETTEEGHFDSHLLEFVSGAFPNCPVGESMRLAETGTPLDKSRWLIMRLE